MITEGAPGKLTPYALYSGVEICISNHSEGRLRPKCGSLQSIGLPLAVLLPATVQLLLPLFLSGLIGFAGNAILSLKLKYNESASAGGCGSTEGCANAVPLGIIGSNESGL